jgi:NADPH-dependent ferric siderophore reductase
MDRQDQNTGVIDQIGNFLARKGRRVWPLAVTAKAQIGPRMVRVSFAGQDLDELKWIRGQDVVLELPRADGSLSRRHYTIRRHAAQAMDIDFVLHGDGASQEWLDALQTGDRLDAVGPRGHTHIRAADWHLFSGDETCVPAIFAMLEGLPAGAKAFAFLEAGSEADILPCETAADAKIQWLFRRGAPPGPNRIAYDAVEAFAFPDGEGFAYVIGETGNVRAIRHRLIERGFARERIAAEGYWRPGRIGGHDHV